MKLNGLRRRGTWKCWDGSLTSTHKVSGEEKNGNNGGVCGTAKVVKMVKDNNGVGDDK